ncbi:MAG: FixH family protein [Burkholderiales bacterium]|nr:FixH family protein [Burkholderiales bacterium]PZN05197.1 MAG: hypothetical protein DIU74_02445 [Pseudomonadota bacterium]
MAIPAASLVLGGIMLWLALQSDDGLVVDDYYKQGLAINEVLDKKQRAAELGLRAVLTFSEDRRVVRVLVHGQPTQGAPLLLRFVHPTRAGEDQIVTLHPLGGSMYESTVAALSAGRWHVVLEDEAATWRLSGTWHTSASQLLLEGSAAR